MRLVLGSLLSLVVAVVSLGLHRTAQRAPAAASSPDDDGCSGPRLPTQSSPSLLAPGGEVEGICGFAIARGDDYAWTRHALFVRDGKWNDWVLAGRAVRPIARVVALRAGGLAIVDTHGGLLANRDDRTDQLSPVDDALRRFDLAVTDAITEHVALPDSPLSCLSVARSRELTIVKSPRHGDPGSFEVRLSIDAHGRATRTGSEKAIEVPTDVAMIELERVEEALYLEDDGSTRGEVRVEWTCDGRNGAMTLEGTRARRVVRVAAGWFALR